jgi:hypothetical protein
MRKTAAKVLNKAPGNKREIKKKWARTPWTLRHEIRMKMIESFGDK